MSLYINNFMGYIYLCIAAMLPLKIAPNNSNTNDVQCPKWIIWRRITWPLFLVSLNIYARVLLLVNTLVNSDNTYVIFHFFCCEFLISNLAVYLRLTEFASGSELTKIICWLFVSLKIISGELRKMLRNFLSFYEHLTVWCRWIEIAQLRRKISSPGSCFQWQSSSQCTHKTIARMGIISSVELCLCVYTQTSHKVFKRKI